LPVKPWQITFVFLSMRMDMGLPLTVNGMSGTGMSARTRSRVSR